MKIKDIPTNCFIFILIVLVQLHFGWIELGDKYPIVTGVFFFATLVVAATLYFLPAIAARSRIHPAKSGIAIANLLFGWTILGWAVVLVWAFSNEQKKN